MEGINGALALWLLLIQPFVYSNSGSLVGGYSPSAAGTVGGTGAATSCWAVIAPSLERSAGFLTIWCLIIGVAPRGYPSCALGAKERSERDGLLELCDGAPCNFPGVGCLRSGPLDLVVAVVSISVVYQIRAVVCGNCGRG